MPMRLVFHLFAILVNVLMQKGILHIVWEVVGQVGSHIEKNGKSVSVYLSNVDVEFFHLVQIKTPFFKNQQTLNQKPSISCPDTLNRKPSGLCGTCVFWWGF